MWPALRAHILWHGKCSYKWRQVYKGNTKVNFCYKILDDGFHVSDNKLTCKWFSSGSNSENMRKCYDRYFYFIHQNDLYQNTTFNYDLLFKKKHTDNTPDLLNKIAAPASSIEKNVQQLTDIELQEVLKCLISRKISHKLRILHYLDEGCAKRALKWTVVTSLVMLDGWIMVDEKFTFDGKFFTALRNLWCQQLHYCTKQNLIQMVYYLGRSKEPAPPLLIDRIEKALLQCSDNITVYEWGIICNGFFKMKTKIKSLDLLRHIAVVAMQRLKECDRYILISILKAFRHANYFDEKFMRFVENFARETCEDYNVIECAHFLATFANVGWYSQEVFDSLEARAIHKLISPSETNNGSSTLSSFDIRVKDVARILWAISHTAHKPKSDAFFDIVINAMKGFMDKDFSKNLPYIVDCTQSLIVMGYYCNNILHKLLTKDTLTKLKQSVRRKPFNQLYFINSSVNIEAPGCKNENLADVFEIHPSSRSTYKDTRERNGMEQLITLMYRYCGEKEEFAHSFILPHIAISSICIETNSAPSKHQSDALQLSSSLGSQKVKISLEVLDPTVCLGNCQHFMTGLMITKLRQLRRLNYRVIIFTPEAISRMNEMAVDNLRLYVDHLFAKATTEPVVTIK